MSQLYFLTSQSESVYLSKFHVRFYQRKRGQKKKAKHFGLVDGGLEAWDHTKYYDDVFPEKKREGGGRALELPKHYMGKRSSVEE
ncbi:hypothetical protein GWI33_009795 [Rhynchophorus ferrugineus]|uniref:Uncharacterized protein n=1 Tax=Rhynchophorus ferrugineus TaxID=354439 RepID=A0A834IXS2_RHYFE|nr:hypothetical protein GWI33_009795 [Rhynchophorus ferrugineus]